MSEVLTIKQVPPDLKRYWAEEAKRNSRSVNKEILRLLEEERIRREGSARPAKDIDRIVQAARSLQGFAVVDQRGVDELLYDKEGMPK